MNWWLGGEIGPAGGMEWAGPPWAILLASAIALVVVIAVARGQRPLLSRILETLLTGLAMIGLVIAVARPMWVEEEGRVEPGRVAVLVDASRSMSVLADGQPRSEAVTQILEELDGPDVETFHFGTDLIPGAPNQFEMPGTDLEGALAALGERVAGERLAAVVVVSDGIDRGLLRRRYEAEDAPAPPVVPGPLTVYQVGKPDGIDDLAVRTVDAGGFAFLRSPFRIKAKIRGIGDVSRVVRVSLDRDGAPVTTKMAALDEEGNAEVTFDVTPGEAGRFTYTVSVPVRDNDAVPGNNAMAVVVRVVRDRIRVLQVAGAPSWDVKMLRRFLKGDPSVDLVSFFILRTDRDMDAGYHDRELSLIPFPHDRLFTDDLWTFDLVIFQNFDYRPYFGDIGRRGVGQLLENLADFVRVRGHAFAMVGGTKSFDLGDYAGTPLADILPLEIGLSEGLVLDTPFSAQLTDAGRRHPVTRLVEDDLENAAWWERLHPIDGANAVRGPAAGAAVLLHHPSAETVGGGPMPVLAVREVGAGRTLALTSDSSWRWSFSEAAVGRGNQAYLRFWKNALRWLVKDPATGRVVVDTPRENYAIGDKVRVVTRVRDETFEPLSQALVKVAVEVGSERTVVEGRTGPEGEAVVTLPAERTGAHRVVATAYHDGAELGDGQTVYAVTTRDAELDEVVPDGPFLQWLAQSTDGRYYGPGEVGPPVRDATSGRTVWDRRETSLARAPLLGLLILVCAGLAWILRRRAGLR